MLTPHTALLTWCTWYTPYRFAHLIHRSCAAELHVEVNKAKRQSVTVRWCGGVKVYKQGVYQVYCTYNLRSPTVHPELCELSGVKQAIPLHMHPRPLRSPDTQCTYGAKVVESMTLRSFSLHLRCTWNGVEQNSRCKKKILCTRVTSHRLILKIHNRRKIKRSGGGSAELSPLQRMEANNKWWKYETIKIQGVQGTHSYRFAKLLRI